LWAPWPAARCQQEKAGFWLIQVKSKEEAIAWMKRVPFGDGVVLEIRQVFETQDFGPNLTPELREQEQRLLALEAQPQHEQALQEAYVHDE